MPKKVDNKPDVPWDALIEVLTKAMAGMPCTNRETAAEKAAAHAWMEKERQRRMPRFFKKPGANKARTRERSRQAFSFAGGGFARAQWARVRMKS